MKQKKIGNTTLQTPPIMFGGNVFGWTLDKKESFRILDILLDRGFTFIDTADSYGKEKGLSEKIIGQWMKDRKVRDKITLATKGGNVKTKMPDGSIKRSRDNSPKYLKKCIIDSLGRLQTDHIDLYYTHFDDESTSIVDVLSAYGQVVQEGKIRYIGASNYSPERLNEALELATHSNFPKYEIFQTEYNLMEREAFESDLGELCHKYQVSAATYFSLASGFLTGKYQAQKDFEGTARQGLTEKYFTEKGKKVLKALSEISEEHKASPAAVSLAWILQQPNTTAAVASATKEKHIDAFVEAINLTLTEDDRRKLNEASSY